MASLDIHQSARSVLIRVRVDDLHLVVPVARTLAHAVLIVTSCTLHVTSDRLNAFTRVTSPKFQIVPKLQETIEHDPKPTQIAILAEEGGFSEQFQERTLTRPKSRKSPNFQKLQLLLLKFFKKKLLHNIPRWGCLIVQSLSASCPSCSSTP